MNLCQKIILLAIFGAMLSTFMFWCWEWIGFAVMIGFFLALGLAGILAESSKNV